MGGGSEDVGVGGGLILPKEHFVLFQVGLLFEKRICSLEEQILSLKRSLHFGRISLSRPADRKSLKFFFLIKWWENIEVYQAPQLHNTR